MKIIVETPTVYCTVEKKDIGTLDDTLDLSKGDKITIGGTEYKVSHYNHITELTSSGRYRSCRDAIVLNEL